MDAWALVNEANTTKDSAKLAKVIEDFSSLAQYAEKTRAPTWFKGRVQLLAIAVQLWAITER